MKKLLVTLLLCFSIGAIACPAGTHPVGGVGPHHKGGACR